MIVLSLCSLLDTGLGKGTACKSVGSSSINLIAHSQLFTFNLSFNSLMSLWIFYVFYCGKSRATLLTYGSNYESLVLSYKTMKRPCRISFPLVDLYTPCFLNHFPLDILCRAITFITYALSFRSISWLSMLLLNSYEPHISLNLENDV